MIRLVADVTAWIWALLFTEIGLIDWLLVRAKKLTLSQRAKKWLTSKWWWGAIGIGVTVVFLWHLFTVKCSACEAPPDPPPCVAYDEEGCL